MWRSENKYGALEYDEDADQMVIDTEFKSMGRAAEENRKHEFNNETHGKRTFTRKWGSGYSGDSRSRQNYIPPIRRQQNEINKEYQRQKREQLRVNNAYVETKMADILVKNVYRIVCEYLLPTVKLESSYDAGFGFCGDENMLEVFCQNKFIDFITPSFLIISNAFGFRQTMYSAVTNDNFELLGMIDKVKKIKYFADRDTCQHEIYVHGCVFGSKMSDVMLDHLMSKCGRIPDPWEQCEHFRDRISNRANKSVDGYIKYSKYGGSEGTLVKNLAHEQDIAEFNRLLATSSNEHWKTAKTNAFITETLGTYYDFAGKLKFLHENKITLEKYYPDKTVADELIRHVDLLTEPERDGLVEHLTTRLTVETMLKNPIWKKVIYKHVTNIVVKSVGNQENRSMVEMLLKAFPPQLV